MRKLRTRVFVLILIAGALNVVPARAASLTEVLSFGSNPGNLQMFKYVPDGLASNRPLVVAMHGCSQSASSFDDETGWTKWADLYKFALLLPQQKSGNNISKCFNWFLTGDQTRDQGEALSIKQMVDWMKANHVVDPNRVFATGLSAGGAMTAVMIATYPDVFKGGAPVAGIPYKCASTVGGASNCNGGSVNLTPTQWGDKVRAASSWTGPWPKVSIWHGDADGTVSFNNFTEMMEQWTNVNGIDQVADVNDTVKGYPHAVYKNGSGSALVETFRLTGMGHGQPVDPGTGSDQCGVAGAYILDVNICGSYFISQWFGVNV